MSIFGRIIGAIQDLFGSSLTYSEMAAALDKRAAESKQRLDWRQSIVDLMKLVGLDSSLSSRKQLAEELGYTGKLDGSAEMNIWLHGQVMERLAAHGGTPPDSLRGA